MKNEGDSETNNNENSSNNLEINKNHTVSDSIGVEKSYYEFSNIKKKHLGNEWHSVRSNSFDLGDHINRRIKFSKSISPVSYSPTKIKNVRADFFNEPSNKIDLRALDLAHVEVYPHHNSDRRDNPCSFGSTRNCTVKYSSQNVVKPNAAHVHESKSAFVVLPQNKRNDDIDTVSQCSNILSAANDSHSSKHTIISTKKSLLQEKNVFENLFSESVLVANTESITFNKRSMTDYITTIEEHSDIESPLARSPAIEGNNAELSKENLAYSNDADNLSKSIQADVNKSKQNVSPTSVLALQEDVATVQSPKIIFVKNKYATQRSAPSGFSVDPIIKSHTVVSSHSSEFPDRFYEIVDDPDALYFPVSPIAESRTKYPVENLNESQIHYEMQMQHLIRPSARRTHSVSHCLDMTCLSPPSLDPGQSRRHRHSISGQMSYFRMSGYGLIVQHQKRGGSTSSLFSTAVISGSSSAPNLRDMIPNTASVAGKYK